MKKHEISFRDSKTTVTAFCRDGEDWQDAALRAARRALGRRVSGIRWNADGKSRRADGSWYSLYVGTVVGRPFPTGGAPVLDTAVVIIAASAPPAMNGPPR